MNSSIESQTSPKSVIVVQGPCHGKRTRDIIEYYLIHNPVTQLILSTWPSLAFEDHGFAELAKKNARFAVISPSPPAGNGGSHNRHFHRHSAWNGIKHAESLLGGEGVIITILVTRTDQLFRKPNICQYLDEILTHNKNRFIVGHGGTTLEEKWGRFHIGDFWIFSTLELLKQWYDIRGIDTTASYFRDSVPIHSQEADFTQTWMYNQGLTGKYLTMQSLLAERFIVLDNDTLGLVFKTQPLSIDDQELKRFWDSYGNLEDHHDGKTVRHKEWLQMFSGGMNPPVIDRVYGQPHTKDKWIGAVILQGPYIKDITVECIRIFAERNTSSPVLIVVSTYDRRDLVISTYERTLVKEGRLVYLFLQTPCKIKYPDFWRTNQHNQNMQRLSSFAGLRYVHELGIEFSLKIRADTFLGKLNVIEILRRRVEVENPVIHPSSMSGASPMRGRIVVSGPGTMCEPDPHPQFPFYVRDNYYFGYTEDLMRFFDMTERSGWQGGRGMTIAHPESALTVRWIQDLQLPVTTTWELAARYLILEDVEFVEMGRLEGDPRGRWWIFDFPRYLREGVEYIRELNTLQIAGFLADGRPNGLSMTREAWLKLVNKVSHEHDESSLHSPAEDAKALLSFSQSA